MNEGRTHFFGDDCDPPHVPDAHEFAARLRGRPDAEMLKNLEVIGVDWKQMYVAAQHELGRMDHEAHLLRAMLRSVQWNGHDWVGSAPCVLCGGEEAQGHDKDCELARLLQGEA